MIALYTLPSIAALALKLLLFWYGRKSLTSASIWLWAFFAGLFGMNFIELMGFHYINKADKGFAWLTWYYLLAEFTFLSLLALALENARRLTTITKYTLAACGAAGALPLLIPGAALAGAESIGYSVTRIPGPYYFVVQLGILGPIAATIIVAGFYANHKDDATKRKSQILLISCSPIFLTVFIIMGLMQFGYKINASVILSLMINLTLLILIYTERKERQFKFMAFIPNSRENAFVSNLTKLVSDPSIGLDKGRMLIEQEMIREALILTDGNKVKAAEMLGVSRQTLTRRLNEAEKEKKQADTKASLSLS